MLKIRGLKKAATNKGTSYAEEFDWEGGGEEKGKGGIEMNDVGWGKGKGEGERKEEGKM